MDGRFALISLENQKLLRRSGFTEVREVLKLSASDLAKELGMDLCKALLLQQELRGSGNDSPTSSSSAATTAADIIQTLSSPSSIVRNITTCCMSLDNLLGGGAPRGSLTELCGAPGSGKTQICMQLSVACSIPEPLGGVEGKTLYLDTEGSFSPQRVFDMAEATSRHLQVIGGRPITSMDILSSILVSRAHDVGDLRGWIDSLPGFIKTDPAIKLIVIDSIAHHFRHDFADFHQKNRVLARIAAQLNAVAQEFDVAIVVTNHMTTARDELTPALGETWFHAVTNRLVLRKSEEWVHWEQHNNISSTPATAESTGPVLVPVRVAELVKSSSLCCNAVEFVVVKIGIRQRPREQPRMMEGLSDSAKRVRV